METVDVVVIGAGPAGYSAAIRLAQAGLSTVCVEREAVGGVCLNWGCIPSKALISVAERYQKTLHGARFGIHAERVTLDMPTAQRHVRSIVEHHTSGVAGLLQNNGVRMIRGTARFVNPRRIAVESPDGSRRELEARRAIVIGAGARSREVHGFAPDGKRILTAKEAVFLQEVPKHLIVLGGGVIGLELGSAYLNLGAKLTVVEMSGSLLPGVDDDLVAVVRKRLLSKGVDVHLATRALGWEPTAGGARVMLSTAGNARAIEGSHVLVAAGFVPDAAALNLEAAEVRLDAQGHVFTTEDCQTSMSGVYAIGDIAGPPYLAHKAFAEALVVSEAITGHRARRDWKAMPAAIFTDPEIATVGLSENQAKTQGLSVSVGRFPYAALGRAGAQGEKDGHIKLLSVDGRLVGAGLVGVYASELISELALAIEVGTTLEDLSLTVHPHPTLSEGVHDAADHGLGRAVHVLNRRAATGGGQRVE